MASGKPPVSVASASMIDNNLSVTTRLQIGANEAGDPVVALADYARLRGLAANHELADELDRAIVVQTELVPKDVVTMQLNIDAMRAVVENSSAIAHLLLESSRPEAALSGLTGRWQPEIERVDDYFRGVLEITQEAAKCSLAR